MNIAARIAILRALAIASLFAPTTAPAAATPPAPSGVAFQFAPPLGTKFRLVHKQTRARLVDGQPPQIDEAESTSIGRFTRSGTDHQLTLEPQLASLRRNGQPLDDPVAAALGRLSLSYVIDGTGQARQVQGFGGIEASLQRSLPPAVAAALAGAVAEPALVAREKAEWDARHAGYAGRTFEIGAPFEERATYGLPGGDQLEYRVRTTLTGWEPCAAGQCMRIEQTFDTDAPAPAARGPAPAAQAAQGQSLSERIAAAVKSTGAATNVTASGDVGAAPAAAAPAAGAVAGPRLTGKASRLIDPATMRIYAETSAREITLPGKPPAPATTLREQRSWVYDYR